MFQKNGYDLRNCTSCEIAFVSPMPTKEDLIKLYDLSYFKGDVSKFGYVDYFAEGPFQRRSFTERSRIIQKNVKSGNILDVGCATGSFLELFGSSNWHKYGIEISQELLSQHPPAKDIDIWCGDFLDYPGESRFHVLTLWDILDHVLRPDLMLKKANHLLINDGLLVLNVGDRASLFAKLLGPRWYLYIPPTHLFYFTLKSLKRLLGQCGFEVSEVIYEKKWVPLRLCFYRLTYIFKGTWTKKLYDWIKDSKLGDKTIGLNFYDVVTLYARKTEKTGHGPGLAGLGARTEG